MRRRNTVWLIGAIGALLIAGLGARALGDSAAARGAASSVTGPRLVFSERTHDFGKISASQKQEHRFAFTNTGTASLQIGDVRLAPPGPGG